MTSEVKVPFWKEREPVARKQHVCVDCGGPILPGEKYHYEVGTCYRDGGGKEFWHATQCLRCKQAWELLAVAEYRETSYCEPFAYGELKQRVQQVAEEGKLITEAEQGVYYRFFPDSLKLPQPREAPPRPTPF